jgi:5-amino-6-(5-phosphoribosylamino)uracil reductase
LRLVLAVSLDGRLAPPEGGAAQLGGKGDRRVLEEALAWADAVLVGARTLRLHRSSCLIRASDLLRQRQDQGLAPQPTVIVWSRSGHFAPDLPFFQQPLTRWLLLANAHPLPCAVAGFSQVHSFVNWMQTLSFWSGLGVARVAVLGGAELAGSLFAARVLDELQLTVCPMVLGGPHGWLAPHAESDPGTHWALRRHEPLIGGELLLHYQRQSQDEEIANVGRS